MEQEYKIGFRTLFRLFERVKDEVSQPLRDEIEDSLEKVYFRLFGKNEGINADLMGRRRELIMMNIRSEDQDSELAILNEKFEKMPYGDPILDDAFNILDQLASGIARTKSVKNEL